MSFHGNADAATQAMTVRNFSFSPATFSAAVGETVTVNVTNSGPSAHTFTINGVTDSGQIAPGTTKTVQFTPTQAGTLVFYCTIHGQAVMSGQLTVTAAAAPAAPAPQTAPAAPPAARPQSPAPSAPPAALPPLVMRPPATGDGGLK